MPSSTPDWIRGISAIQWHAVRLYRAADRLHRRGHPAAAVFVAAANRVLTGVDIEPGATIGPGLVIMHGHGIVINRAVRAGKNLEIYQQVTLGVNNRHAPGSPVLGDDVVIFPGARILGPVTIGDGAVIGANAVVLSDIPAGAVAVGVPARIL